MYHQLKTARPGAILSFIDTFGGSLHVYEGPAYFIFEDGDDQEVNEVPFEVINALAEWLDTPKPDVPEFAGFHTVSADKFDQTEPVDEEAENVKSRVNALLAPLRAMGLDISVLKVERV